MVELSRGSLNFVSFSILCRIFHGSLCVANTSAPFFNAVVFLPITLLRVGSLLLPCGARFCIVAKKKPRDARGAVVVVPQSAVEDEVEGARFRFFEGGHFACFSVM